MPEPMQFQSGGIQGQAKTTVVAEGMIDPPVPDVMIDAQNAIIDSMEHMQKTMHVEVDRRMRAESEVQRLEAIITELKDRASAVAKDHSEISNQ